MFSLLEITFSAKMLFKASATGSMHHFDVLACVRSFLTLDNDDDNDDMS